MLKLTIHEDPTATEIEVSIVCPEITGELKDMIANIGLIGHTFAGDKDGETFFIPVKDIFILNRWRAVSFFIRKRICTKPQQDFIKLRSACRI